MSDAPAWTPDDELGDAFSVATLPAPGTSGGPRNHGGAVPPRVTLVRAAAGRLGGDDGTRPRAVVLHVHGYNDYFFQAHLAAALTGAGYAFVAVDLRRAGRSWRPGEVPHYVDDLHEHAADLTLAAAAARALHPGLPLVVHAHSTGGLTAALWAHAARRGPDGPDLLVLDSPFLDLRSSWFNRTVGTRLLDAVGPYAALRPMTNAPSVYATHQHVSGGGRWEFDTALKRPEGLPVRAGWLRAVRRGQARVERGLDVAAPVLVARSARSGPDREGNPDLDREDTVLDVRSIARLAPRLGHDVTELVVDGGVHDLTLSADGPRAAYLDGVLSWAGERLAAPRPGTAR
ncbi:alpha/beta fold hydrolase [Luteimicrobium sp. DT211]|uniref:alpha/beta fold hydrolase n=1 Tax=Luteimicrobium sp. DT211 TaxID=3393412 RepID=UPI003CEC2239